VAGSWFELSLDRAVPFDPRWTWVYLSLYLLMPLFPWCTTSRQRLLRYAWGFSAVAVVSFLLFVLVPVDSPRPLVASSILQDHVLYRHLISIEGPGNAFPSLHAGLATYSWLYGRRLLAAERWAWPTEILTVAALWVGLILVSTLLTRQHWTLDLAAGLVVGWAGDRWAFRDSTFGGGNR
jgi:membrane-associated phospholipid phosphatase